MSTSEPYPLYNALRGTLLFEVNFTGRGYPLQKCLWGRLDNLVKFTFRAHPLQKAFWGTLLFEVNFTGYLLFAESSARLFPSLSLVPLLNSPLLLLSSFQMSTPAPVLVSPSSFKLMKSDDSQHL